MPNVLLKNIADDLRLAGRNDIKCEVNHVYREGWFAACDHLQTMRLASDSTLFCAPDELVNVFRRGTDFIVEKTKILEMTGKATYPLHYTDGKYIRCIEDKTYIGTYDTSEAGWMDELEERLHD